MTEVEQVNKLSAWVIDLNNGLLPGRDGFTMDSTDGKWRLDFSSGKEPTASREKATFLYIGVARTQECALFSTPVETIEVQLEAGKIARSKIGNPTPADILELEQLTALQLQKPNLAG